MSLALHLLVALDPFSFCRDLIVRRVRNNTYKHHWLQVYVQKELQTEQNTSYKFQRLLRKIWNCFAPTTTPFPVQHLLTCINYYCLLSVLIILPYQQSP